LRDRFSDDRGADASLAQPGVKSSETHFQSPPECSELPHSPHASTASIAPALTIKSKRPSWDESPKAMDVAIKRVGPGITLSVRYGGSL